MTRDQRTAPPLWLLVLAGLVALGLAIAERRARRSPAREAGALAPVTAVDLQPFGAQVRRLIEASAALGEPFGPQEVAELEGAMRDDGPDTLALIQRVLDARCLFVVSINPEMRVKAARGPAAPRLVARGWRLFLVKVVNESGTTAALRITSRNARALHNAAVGRGHSDEMAEAEAGGPRGRDAWLALDLVEEAPMLPTLSGLGLEYRIIQLYSRDAGMREARFVFDAGEATQDLGFRSAADVVFDCAPSRPVRFRVRDEERRPTTASFRITDAQGRAYPPPAKRLAPDLPFQPQVYVSDGESIELPAGSYRFTFRRGPESLAETRAVTVGDGPAEVAFRVRRWIDPAKSGWWSGDHHLHAAGCSHYSEPTEGVRPEDMMRHVVGEDLKVGAILNWGPGYDFQRQFFCGHDDRLAAYPHLLHYDLEVSGFGSHQSGHLVLLGLREQQHPGTTSTTGWPTLGLNTLRWAKRQGAVTGFAHSGLGLRPDASTRGRPAEDPEVRALRAEAERLPNYLIPPFDGIGANEYIVDVTHHVPGPDGGPVPAVDFISLGNTPHTWELNIWYHTLNAGFRTRVGGETDFPCMSDARVGAARSYVKVDGPLTYEKWCRGLQQGRSYMSDGSSHLLDFTVGGQPVGERNSELALAGPGTVTVAARVAALLPASPEGKVRGRPARERPYWDLERARIDGTRQVPVEVIVNGEAVAQAAIEADGSIQDVRFEVPVAGSSWIALRVRASSHTNPVFVTVDGRPIRASRRSLEWCLQAVDRCWSQKRQFIAAAEMPQAEADYEHARAEYRRRLLECAMP